MSETKEETKAENVEETPVVTESSTTEDTTTSKRKRDDEEDSAEATDDLSKRPKSDLNGTTEPEASKSEETTSAVAVTAEAVNNVTDTTQAVATTAAPSPVEPVVVATDNVTVAAAPVASETAPVVTTTDTVAVPVPAGTVQTVATPNGAQPLPAGQDLLVLEIAQEKVGQVIGSKGMVIQEIQTRSGARAYVNQDFPDGVNRQVNITGSAAQVKMAGDLIKLIIEQGPTAIHVNSMQGGPTTTSVVECTQPQVGKIIGTGGATIKELQSKSGARIQIDQDFPPDVPRKINITGTAPAVALAMQLVQNLMLGGNALTSLGLGNPANTNAGGMINAAQGVYGPGAGMGMGGMPSAGPSPITYGPGGEAKQSLDVAKSYVGKIIGRGGETITMIQRKSGARVTVDQNVPEGMPNKVMMTGTPQAITMASQMVQEVMMGVATNQLGMSGGGMPQQSYGQQQMYAPAMQAQQPYGMGAYGMPPQQQMLAPQQQQYGGYSQYAQPQQQVPQMQQQMAPVQQQQQYPAATTAAGGAYQAYGAAAGAYGTTPVTQQQQATTTAAYTGQQQQQTVAGATAAAKPAAASVWTEHKTDDGVTYWYNASTGVSQWERPKN